MIRARSIAAAMFLAVFASCGTSALVPVRGKVVYNGQPVTEGSLLFAPQDSEANVAPATGIIQSDGRFALGTQQDADGAAPGKHKVHYTAPAPTGPEWLGYGPKPQLKYSPFHGLVPKESEVEIKSGQPELTIELVRGAP